MSITRDEWLKAMDEAGMGVAHDPDAITIDEFAALVQLGRAAASRRLELLVASGRATRTQRRGTASNGRTQYLVAYRLKRGAATTRTKS